MGDHNNKIIIGVSVGVAVGILIGIGAFIIKWYIRRSKVGVSTLPTHVNGSKTNISYSASVSDSEAGDGFQYMAQRNYRMKYQNKDLSTSLSGIFRYSYKDIQKATQNFTAILGQGSFGPVYKAVMPTSEVVAVKVLADGSSQGEKEFQTEVLLLSRLHHRNLVNLVGYCVDKGQHMLIYEFMSNGNLASHLYGDNQRTLSWDERLQIALDISHGIEYLHDGATPPVIHRDLKSANILLDKSMRAKVSDFGLSKEEIFDGRMSSLKGTYGYMDPDYMSTKKYTKKSDIYSFGVILFELITAINSQQGLMDYIDLASIGEDGKADWDEIIDKRLTDRSNPVEVRLLADIGYKCLHKLPKKRPSIAEVTQAISRIRQQDLPRTESMLPLEEEKSVVLRRIEVQQVELSQLTHMKSYLSGKVSD